MASLRVGILTEVKETDPRLSGDFANLAIRWQVYESAFRLTEGGKDLESCLLEWPLRAEAPEDGRPVFSAAVVPQRRFSDGSPVTPERVRDSLQATPLLRPHAEVGLRDGRLTFKLVRPYARFELLLANYHAPIVAAGPAGRAPLGTGPFVLEPGGRRLRRNPHHPRQPLVDEAVIDVYPPAADGQALALIEAVNAGQVDFTNQVPYSALPQLKNVRKISSLGSSTCSLFFNTERPALADPRVRRALARAVDRQGIAAACYANPLAFVARGLLPPLLGQAEDKIEHEPHEARRLLAEAGAATPARPLDLLVMPLARPYLPDPQGVGKRLVDAFAAVGWSVQANVPASLADYVSLAGRAAYDLALQGWIPDSYDPLEFLEVHLDSSSIPVNADDIFRAANLARYRSAEADRLLAAHRAQGDPESWQALQRLLANDVPLLPIMYGPSVSVLSWRVAQKPVSVLYRPFLAEIALRE